MNPSAALYVFLAAGAVALFAFASVVQWAKARTAERIARERYALLRKLAEQPRESAQLVLDVLQEDDRRQELKDRARARQARRETIQGGAVTMAVGAGLSLALAGLAPRTSAWTLGVMLILIGIVIVAFAYFGKTEEA